MAPLGPLAATEAADTANFTGPFINDEQWATPILAAALPHTPGPAAREAVEEAASDYVGLRGVPEKVRTARQRYLAVIKAVDAAMAALTSNADKAALADLQRVREHAETLVEATTIIIQARRGRSDPARDWLIVRLLRIWVFDFGGSPSVPPDTAGEPGGPVPFIAAVLEALGEPTSAFTIRNAIGRLKPFDL